MEKTIFSFFTIIEKCLRHELNEREIYWINKLNSRLYGYNLTDGGNGCLGRVYTEQQIKDKCYTIFQLSLDGSFIEKWDRASDAADALNISCRSIQGVAGPNPKYKTAGGYIWVYEKDFENFNLDNHIDSKKKKIMQYDLNWNLIKSWDSISSVENNGYSASAVSKACRGENKQAYGYIWTYGDVDLYTYIEWYNDYFDIKYIGQYDKFDNLLKIWRSPEDTKEDGFSPVVVRANILGKYKTHRGYIFKCIPWRELKTIEMKGII